MKAQLLLQQRTDISGTEFAEVIIWRLPAPLKGSAHSLKYRLAFVANGDCVIRYDNEAGKGDHRHVGSRELPYKFVDIDTLLVDFERDIERWRK